MRLNLIKTTGIIAYAVVFMYGCRKERADTDIFVSLDNAIAEGSFNDLQLVVNQQAAENGFADLLTDTHGKLADECPETAFSAPLGEFPNTMTIDFGETCVSFLGAERSGIVTATFTGPYGAEGTEITVTPLNYYVNGNKVEGIKSIRNEGLNADGNIYFSVTVTDGLITLEDGATISWDATRIREWREGSGTLALLDDVYAISNGLGSEFAATGINRNGIAFTTHIAEPLVKDMACLWIISGIVEVTPEELTTRILDFGDGTCDNKAMLSIGEYSTEITLPY